MNSEKVISKNRQALTVLVDFLEAPPRFELGVKVLQTSALPLGYGALRIVYYMKQFFKS